ncbi:MAG TPA: uracil-DNA glycosylase family protein [Mucilaginibacter sp.]|jgi:hypothetical protein|nr:uracil-DNA glycosylase family protein [Mucilaginibacter sp.]
MTFADKVIQFNKQLDFDGALPDGIRIMNPFKENAQVNIIMEQFYKKYYDDNYSRHLILGINPGRFGAGVTGIPFTDSKRLKSVCKIDYKGKETHEPSSVFVYEMIEAFGGAERFYQNFYIHSICPLGFTSVKSDGKEINYNYYDSHALTAAVYDFMVENIGKQISFGVDTDTCICFGNGKNEKFLRKLNDKEHFFKNIIALEHPRFIMQYKSRSKDIYIKKYIDAFNSVL